MVLFLCKITLDFEEVFFFYLPLFSHVFMVGSIEVVVK